VTGIGHNNPPRDRSFKKRWASAIFACDDPKKPVGAVAMAFRLYHDMDGTGRGIAASDLEIAESCGVSDRSVRTFKTWLLRLGFVRVIAKGGRGDGKTEYRALIPGEIELPEKSAGQIEVRPETISGNCELNRKSFPEKENGFPEKISGKQIKPEKSAGDREPHSERDNNYAHAVDSNIYINNNNLSNLSTSLPREAVPKTADDFKRLSERLLSACNGALDNPVNCQGLASLATPIMWLEQGCDLERDVIPTLTAFGKTAHGKRIRTWNYFSNAVSQARDTRLAGLPGKQTQSGGRQAASTDDTIRQIDAIMRGGR